MFASVVTCTECKVYEVNPIGVDNCEGFSASLGTCTPIRRVVTKLENVTSLPE
jgi:hypothetical protein